MYGIYFLKIYKKIINFLILVIKIIKKKYLKYIN